MFSGISFRSSFIRELFEHKSEFDFLEIIADHYIQAPAQKRYELELLKKNFTLIPHAINLSPGNAEGVNKKYVSQLKELIDYLKPPYWSEHISYSSTGDHEIGHLSPMAFTEASVGVLAKNMKVIRKQISTPLILENIAYQVVVKGAEMTEVEFIRMVVEKCECQLLLDATNLCYNAGNYHYDWKHFLDQLPAGCVKQLHYTGGMFRDSRWIDNHSSPTPEPVWEIIREIKKRFNPWGACLERDDSEPPFGELIGDVRRIKGPDSMGTVSKELRIQPLDTEP